VSPSEPVRTSGEGEQSFEELQKELEDIVARLERGDVAVDDAIALFRRGEELYRACVQRLERAELRIEELAREEGSGS
jgi:exodeoxyribonuclease VII small subunit